MTVPGSQGCCGDQTTWSLSSTQKGARHAVHFIKLTANIRTVPVVSTVTGEPRKTKRRAAGPERCCGGLGACSQSQTNIAQEATFLLSWDKTDHPTLCLWLPKLWLLGMGRNGSFQSLPQQAEKLSYKPRLWKEDEACGSLVVTGY